MKKYTACILLFLSFLVCFGGFAQTNPPPITADLFPPTPNAAALAKFVDQPVSLATGIPQIDVPIYTYKGNGLGLNISLDYHAGGVRVEEVASDVGIGWALNAGGQVSRTVRGLPDDIKTTGYFYLSHLSTFDTYLVQSQNSGNGFLKTSDSLYKFYKNLKDSQSDIFSYSINGKSGKFVYGLDGNYMTIPQSKVKIQRIISATADANYSLIGFIITDIDGTQYSYTKNDVLFNSAYSIQGAYAYATSWNLTKIVAPFKTDSITMTYENAGINYYIGKSEINYKQTGSFDDPALVNSSSVNTYNGNINRIKQINLPDSTHVIFNYESVARKDITATGALKEIIISGGGKSYGYHLYHSYGSHGAYTGGSVSPAYRLQMDSVAQFSGSTFLPAYKFTYNGTLPYRLSTAQDYWGFPYDSLLRANSNTLIPKIYTSANSFYDGADRTPDTIKSQLGAMTMVQYPTGGTTSFTYQSNRGNVMLNRMIPQRIQVPTTTLIPTHTQAFTVNRPWDYMDPMIFNFTMGAWCSDTPTGACKFVFKVKNMAGDTTFATASFGNTEVNTTKAVSVTVFHNGNYQLTWEFDDPSHCSCSDVFGMSFSYNQDLLDTADLAGGIRVKKTVMYDGVSHSNDITKEYYYAPGSVSEKPKFDFNYTATNTFDVGPYFVRSSSAYYPLAGANGSPVAYNMVTVKQNGANGYLGKSVHQFTDYGLAGYPDCADSDGGPCPPFVTQPDKGYTIGLPTTEQYFDSSNRLLKRVVNNYNYISTNDQYFVPNYRSFKFIITEQSHETDPPTYLLFSWLDFYQQTGRIEKSSTVETDYTTAGDSLRKETDFTYDTTYYNEKTSYTYDSRNQKIEQRLYYPYDYTITGPIATLKASGIISPVISQETWLTDNNSVTSMVGGSITDYGVFQHGIIRPKAYYTIHSIPMLSQATIGAFNPALLNRNTTYFVQDLTYDKFDSKGNISQFTNKVPKTSFIWDLNKQRPIAKIINADSASVAYTSFEADGTGNWTVASSTRDTTTAITGKTSYNLANGSVSISGLTSTQSYVVSYWSKSGSYSVTNGGTPITGVALNGWTYYEHAVTGTTSITVSGSGNIDELRLYPQFAQMNTYTYDPLAGVTSTADVRNQINYYEYDGLLRLKNIKDQYGNIIKNYCYNYAGQTTSSGCAIFNYYNVLESGQFKKNNCTGNYTGSLITYTVAANTYSSTISQADANNKAIADVNTNGPTYANTNGTCVLCTGGNAYKAVNNNCEMGTKVYDSSTLVSAGHYTCTYHYTWSDGSNSTEYSENNTHPCAF